MRRGLEDALEALDADVIALQEIKCEQHQLQAPVLRHYNEYWNSTTAKKGYSGTLILTRQATLATRNDFGTAALDSEVRVISAFRNHCSTAYPTVTTCPTS